MSVKIRIVILVVLLLSVVGVTAVSASSTLPVPNNGVINPQYCTGCVDPYYGWFCRDDGNIAYYDPGCVWRFWARCNTDVMGEPWCTCTPLGPTDYCTYGLQ